MEKTTHRLTAVAQRLAQTRLPATIIPCLGLGRIVALEKNPMDEPERIVIADVLRRLVSRNLAQMFAGPIHTNCALHQFALSTRTGTEAVVHALTAATEANPANTVVSVDGTGAYDIISRDAMLRGPFAVPAANRCLPFVGLFYDVRRPALPARLAGGPRTPPPHQPSRGGLSKETP